MHILRTTPRLNRRDVLKGIGVSLALPFLDCMLPARSSAATEALKPRRSIFICLPDGVHVRAWQITEAGPKYNFSRSLAPLEKHRALITPISGLHLATPRAGHCQSCFLRGAERDPGTGSISVDQVIAEKTAAYTRFPSLEIGGEHLATNANGISLPIERNPESIFQRFFVGSKDGITKQRRNLNRRGSMLDTVLDDARSLNRQLGNDDRGRLQDYIAAVREVEVRLERANAWLDKPLPKLEPAQEERVNKKPSAAGGFGEYLRITYDLIALAFQADLTRVVTFSTGQENTGSVSPEIGITVGRHGLSHKQNEDLVKSDIYNIEQFSYFLDRLVELRDGNGPLIDSTMALIGSQMSNGCGHVTANLPFVLAGGKGLGIKHGSHVDFNAAGKPDGFKYDMEGASIESVCTRPVNQRARHSNLLLTIAQKMGVERQKFGDSTGVISEVM